MDKEWRDIIIIYGILILLFLLVFIGGEIFREYKCNNLETDLNYQTEYSWYNDCFVRFKSEWYPKDTFYQVLENDFKLELGE